MGLGIFDIEGARKAGFSDKEIADELGKNSGFDTTGARAAGFKDEEIIQQLMGTTPVASRQPFYADESPLEVTPKTTTTFIKGEPQTRIQNQRAVDLGKSGVILDTPGTGILDANDYMNLAYYSAGPEYAAKWVGKKAKEKYAPNSNLDPEDLVRTKNGKIQYIDLSLAKPRWRELDENAFYSFGKPAFWGEVGSDLVLGGGATLAGALASPFVGAVAGSAVAGANSAAWRRAALRRGRELGINEGLSDEDINSMAIGRGMQTAGGSALFGAFGAMPRTSQSNNLFSRETAQGILDDVDTNLAKSGTTVAEVNSLRPGADEQFNPTVAQRTGVGEALDIEATLEAGHAATPSFEISNAIKEQKVRNKRVLQSLWNELFPDNELPITDLEDVGMGIRASAYEAAGNSAEAKATRAATTAKATLRKEVDQLPDNLSLEDVLREIRGEPSPNGHLSGTKFYQLQDAVNSKHQQLVDEVYKRGRNVSVEISDKNLLLPQLKRLRAQLNVGLESLGNAVGKGRTLTQLDELINTLETHEGKVSFNYLDQIMQDYGTLIGRIKTAPGRGVGEQNEAHISEIMAVLDDAMNNYAKTGPVNASDLVQTWHQRRDWATLKHDIFDRKAVRQLFANAEPDGPTARAVFNDLFTPESAKYLGRLVELVQGDQESMNGLRKLALYRYKQAVTRPDGSVSLDSHAKFIQKYGEHLKLLFPESDTPFARVGALETAVLAAEQKAKQLDIANRRAWYNVFGKNDQYNSYTLVNRLASGKLNTKNADYLIAHLEKNDPELLGLVRQEAKNQFRLRMGATDIPSADALLKFVQSPQGRNFSRLMGESGDGYLRNIKTLGEAIELSNRSGSSRGAPSTNIVVAAARATLGPLSRAQRFITASRQAYGWMSAKNAYEVISDPKRLRRALQYAASAPSMKAVPQAVMSDIGALSVLMSSDNY